MRTVRILALSAAALVGVGVLVAQPASAVTNVPVDCASGLPVSLTVSPGESVLFDFGTTPCPTLITGLEAALSVPGFVDLVALVADTSGTGGTAVADEDSLTVLYTAGPRSGTDSIVMDVPVRRTGYRAVEPANVAIYMTVPGGAAGPAPWPQAIGRPGQDAVCPATYSPSWAQWPNGNTGGWVCVREYYYDSTLGDWSYRRG